jgi:hypothetical protein
VQIEGDDPIGTGAIEEASQHFGTDRTLARATLLPTVAKVGHEQVQPAGPAALQGVGQQQELQDGFAGAGGLEQDHTVAPHGLLHLDADLAVRKVAEVGASQRDAGATGQVPGQGGRDGD